MILELIITLGALSIVLLIVGFFLNPPNPYLVLFSSMIMLIIALDVIVTGVEIESGEFTINATPVGNITITTVDPIIETYTGIRADGLSIIILLLSLYLAWFSISEILRNKYGDANVE